jgi:hypothetical protein
MVRHRVPRTLCLRVYVREILASEWRTREGAIEAQSIRDWV